MGSFQDRVDAARTAARPGLDAERAKLDEEAAREVQRVALARARASELLPEVYEAATALRRCGGLPFDRLIGPTQISGVSYGMLWGQSNPKRTGWNFASLRIPLRKGPYAVVVRSSGYRKIPLEEFVELASYFLPSEPGQPPGRVWVDEELSGFLSQAALYLARLDAM